MLMYKRLGQRADERPNGEKETAALHLGELRRFELVELEPRLES